MSKGNGPDAPVLNGCLGYLQARGIYHWLNSTGAVHIGPGRFMRFGKVGLSDILGILPGGRLLYVECKARVDGSPRNRNNSLPILFPVSCLFSPAEKNVGTSERQRLRVAFDPGAALATRIFLYVFYMCYRYY